MGVAMAQANPPHMVPEILITTTILDAGSPNVPEISLTHQVEDLDDVGYNDLYPVELLDMAASTENRPEVELFLSDRLTSLGLSLNSQEAPTCRCERLQEILECPVCLEQVRNQVFQCFRGHIMCGRCRARVPRCPVCRATLNPSTHQEPCLGATN